MSRQLVTLTIFGLVAEVVLGLMACGVLSQEPAVEKGDIARREKLAPDFTLLLFSGGEFTLSRYRGQPVIINFWASWPGS